MEETTYSQPFIQLTPIDRYPEIHDITKIVFPKLSEEIHNNLYTILSGLLVYPKLAVSRSYGYYKSFNNRLGWYTRDYAARSQDLLAERGLVRIEKGYRPKPDLKGFSSVISTTDKLDNLLRGIVLKPIKVDPENQAVLTLNRNFVAEKELRELENVIFGDSPLNNDILINNYGRVSRFNKYYFSKMMLGFEDGAIIPLDGMYFEKAREITKTTKNEEDYAFGMATNVFFTSMFTSGGCGRLYQRCQSFQNIPKVLRRHLTINGSKTKQADYSSMHVNIAYFLCGKKNPYADSYEPILRELNLPNNPCLREAVKKCAIVTLNTSNLTTYSRAMNWNNLADVRKLSEYGVSLKEVRSAFVKVHKSLESLLNSNSQKAELMMFVESNIIKEVLDELYRKDIDALPLHDAIIYNEKHEGIVERVMKETYKSVTGNNIIVKTS